MKRLKDETLSIRTSADIKQLLRMAAEREHRSIASMMEVLIQFDVEGRIVATPEKMRDILHVLLDHRLRSELSDNQYDVPSTTPVGQ